MLLAGGPSVDIICSAHAAVRSSRLTCLRAPATADSLTPRPGVRLSFFSAASSGLLPVRHAKRHGQHGCPIFAACRSAPLALFGSAAFVRCRRPILAPLIVGRPLPPPCIIVPQWPTIRLGCSPVCRPPPIHANLQSQQTRTGRAEAITFARPCLPPACRVSSNRPLMTC